MRTKALLSLLRSGRTRITKLFLEQCGDGQQTKSLEDASLAANGQFIGRPPVHSSQRGLFGTSAALSVLSRDATSTEARDLVSRLVAYVQKRAQTERALAPSAKDAKFQRCKADEQNVVKLSDMLVALQSVPPTWCSTESTIDGLVSDLEQGKTASGAWPFFTNQEEDEASPIATLFAARAMRAVGRHPEADAALQFVYEELSRGPPSSRTQHDYAVIIFFLYVATERREGTWYASRENDLRKLLKRYWPLIRPITEAVRVEQNIEYWRNGEALYVRIPWQLYLIAVTLRLNPSTYFSTSVIQDLIEDVAHQADSEGVKYPHSGRWPSARTNAIAFQVIEEVENHWPRGVVLLRGWDWFLTLPRRTLVRWLARLTATGIIGWSLLRWFRSDDASFANLGPSLVAALLLALFSARRSGAT